MTSKAITRYVAAIIHPVKSDGSQITKMPSLMLVEAGCIDDGAYSPPQSINLFHADAIRALRALRDACNEALGESDSDNLRSLIMDLKPPTP